MDDADLVQQAVAGDRQAFAAIYDRYAARVYDFVRALLRDPDEAADVLQDTFLVAGSRLHQLRDPAKLRPWLFAIARHRALRSIEHRSRHRPLDDVDVTASDADPAEEAADNAAGGDLAGLVAAAAEGLGPRDRVVLELHLRQGLEGQELGDAIGVSASHAYVLVSRLRDQVERSLGALLVARQGRDECAELAAVLQDWDGRFTPVWRKRVARHTDGCEVCSDRRRHLLTPGGLLGMAGAAPAFALPPELRDRVLGDLQLCSHAGPPWPGGRDGFPPPLAGAARRRPGLVVAALAALVLIGLGAFGIGNLIGEEKGTTQVAAVGPTLTLAVGPSTSVPAAGSSGPTITLSTPGLPAGEGGTTVPNGSPPGAAADPDPDPGADPGVDPGFDPDPGAGPGSDPDPTDPMPTASTTTVARPMVDTTPPNLTAPVASPGTIQASPRCGTGAPTQTIVTVQATDPSGHRQRRPRHRRAVAGFDDDGRHRGRRLLRHHRSLLQHRRGDDDRPRFRRGHGRCRKRDDHLRIVHAPLRPLSVRRDPRGRGRDGCRRGRRSSR